MYAACCVLDLLAPELPDAAGAEADGAGGRASPTVEEGQRALRSMLQRGRSALVQEVQRRTADGGAPDKLSHRKLIRQAVMEAVQQSGCEVRRQVRSPARVPRNRTLNSLTPVAPRPSSVYIQCMTRMHMCHHTAHACR